MCTMRMCHAIVKREAEAAVDKRLAEAETCAAGETKQIECNRCFCAGGRWACTMMACIPFDNPTVAKREEAECFAGETKMMECNRCFCAGGRWACTEMACISFNGPKVVKRQEAECVVGETKMMECNRCFCAGGRWACTMMACNSFYNPTVAKRQEAECAAGETKMIECNHCFCAGGNWACTLMGCFEPIPIPDGIDLDKKEAKSETEKRIVKQCNPGQRKMLDCNRCICLGNSWACTLKFC